jgi:hypothetical protein
VPAYFKQKLPIGLFKTCAYFWKTHVHPQKLLDGISIISLILTSLRQFDNVFMFGEDIDVNEFNIFLSLLTISYSSFFFFFIYDYKNDKWQITCLIVKQASAYIVPPFRATNAISLFFITLFSDHTQITDRFYVFWQTLDTWSHSHMREIFRKLNGLLCIMVTVYFEVLSKLIIMTFMTIKRRLHCIFFLNDINCCPKFRAPHCTVNPFINSKVTRYTYLVTLINSCQTKQITCA